MVSEEKRDICNNCKYRGYLFICLECYGVFYKPKKGKEAEKQ